MRGDEKDVAVSMNRRSVAGMLAIGTVFVAGLDQILHAQEPVEVVTVELGPNGFYPREIRRRTSGKFYLFVRGELGRDAGILRVDDEAGRAVAQADVSKGGRRWFRLIEGKSRKYTVRVPGKASFALTISIP